MFKNKLLSSLKECIDKARSTTGKLHRDRIWSGYHFLRTSDNYVCDCECILLKAGVSEISAICYQYIGHQILKKLIETTYPLTARKAGPSMGYCELTYEETNVVKSLQEKILKSIHAQRDDIQLCLSQSDDEAQDDSQDWMQLIDRGGLFHVNSDVYELFLALEKELRKHISLNKLLDMTPALKKELTESNPVQFIWYLISADWDDDISTHLLDSIVTEWVKISLDGKI